MTHKKYMHTQSHTYISVIVVCVSVGEWCVQSSLFCDFLHFGDVIGVCNLVIVGLEPRQVFLQKLQKLIQPRLQLRDVRVRHGALRQKIRQFDCRAAEGR